MDSGFRRNDGGFPPSRSFFNSPRPDRETPAPATRTNLEAAPLPRPYLDSPGNTDRGVVLPLFDFSFNYAYPFCN